MKRSKNGPFSAAAAEKRLDTLVVSIERSSFVEPRTLDEIKPFLACSRIPSNAEFTAVGASNIKLALAALNVIEACHDHFPKNKGLVEKALVFCEEVYRWTEFILDISSEMWQSSYYDLVIKSKALATVSSTTSALAYWAPMRCHVLDNTKFLELWFEYWLGGIQAEPFAANFRIYTIVCEVLLRRCPEESQDFERILCLARRRYGLIARTAVAGLRAFLESPFFIVRHTLEYLNLIDHLSGQRDHTMVDALLATGGMHAVIACIHVLNGHADTEMVPHAIIPSYSIIRKWCMESSDNSQTICQAFRSGLMQAIAGSSRYDNRISGLDAILSKFAPYLVHRSIVRAAAIELNQMPQVIQGSDGLKEAWALCRSLIEERRQLKETVDREHGHRCCVCKRTAAELSEPLKRCAQCGFGPQYCSDSCQRQDWPSHKILCRTYQEIGLPPLTFRGAQFICALAEETIRRSWDGILSAVRSDATLSNIPTCDLFVQVDFRTLNIELSVRLLDGFMSEKLLEGWRSWKGREERLNLGILVKVGARAWGVRHVMLLPQSL